MKETRANLKKWLATLSTEQIKAITLDCLEELILTETVRFWDESKAPYWDSNGERLDGSNPE
jgi:hypothetical protein